MKAPLSRLKLGMVADNRTAFAVKKPLFFPTHLLAENGHSHNFHHSLLIINILLNFAAPQHEVPGTMLNT